MCLARYCHTQRLVPLAAARADVGIVRRSGLRLRPAATFLFALGLLPVLHVMSRIGYHYGRIRFIESRASRTLAHRGESAPQKTGLPILEGCKAAPDGSVQFDGQAALKVETQTATQTPRGFPNCARQRSEKLRTSSDWRVQRDTRKTTVSDFQDRCLQPLGHPSSQTDQVVSFLTVDYRMMKLGHVPCHCDRV